MLTILLLALGKYFSVLPKAVLASIVVVNLRQIFKLMFESRAMTHRLISYEPYHMAIGPYEMDHISPNYGLYIQAIN